MYNYKEVNEIKEAWKVSLMWHQLIIIVLMTALLIALIY